MDSSSDSSTSSSDEDDDVSIECAQRLNDWVPQVTTDGETSAPVKYWTTAKHTIPLSIGERTETSSVFDRNIRKYRDIHIEKLNDACIDTSSSSSESSISSDFESPDEDEEPVRIVPPDTFVKSSRIIHPDGRVQHLTNQEKKKSG